MNRLRMENEVSMMRAGYNDGIERYRTVMQRFPEVMLTKMFGLDQKSLAFKSHIRQVQKLNYQLMIMKELIVEELSQQSIEDDEGEDQVEEIEKKANQIASDAKQLSEIYLHKQGEQYGPYDMGQIEVFLSQKILI